MKLKLKLFLIPAFVLIMALSPLAAQTTVTGVVTDDMYTEKHMMPGKGNAECVRECITHGAKYVVVSEGKVLQLQANQSTLTEIAGNKVIITGALKGNVLTVETSKLAD